MPLLGASGVAAFDETIAILGVLMAALAVFVSIVVHGPSHTPEVNWIARRAQAS